MSAPTQARSDATTSVDPGMWRTVAILSSQHIDVVQIAVAIGSSPEAVEALRSGPEWGAVLAQITRPMLARYAQDAYFAKLTDADVERDAVLTVASRPATVEEARATPRPSACLAMDLPRVRVNNALLGVAALEFGSEGWGLDTLSDRAREHEELEDADPTYIARVLVNHCESSASPKTWEAIEHRAAAVTLTPSERVMLCRWLQRQADVRRVHEIV